MSEKYLKDIGEIPHGKAPEEFKNEPDIMKEKKKKRKREEQRMEFEPDPKRRRIEERRYDDEQKKVIIHRNEDVLNTNEDGDYEIQEGSETPPGRILPDPDRSPVIENNNISPGISCIPPEVRQL